MTKAPDFDAVVVGMGITGLYQLYRLRELGYNVLGLEASDNLGGVWHQNRYPGCRIDSESEIYGYFWNKELMQEFNWTERFAAQPEVLRYIHRAADYMDIRKDIRFNSRVESATFDEANGYWTLRLQEGGSAPLTTRFFFTALGPLSAPQMPNVDGVHTFKGETYHTARWPRDPDGFGPAKLDFSGKRVAVIGTGASGIQVIQELAKVAGHLTIFQRSPNWATPLGNGPMAQERMDHIKANYGDFIAACDASIAGFPHQFIEANLADVAKDERDATLDKLYYGPGFSLWLGAYQDVLTDPKANAYVSEFVAGKIRQRVKNPTIAEKLIPRDHGFGVKRVPLETNYFEVYNQDNVELVDLNETPISRIDPTGIQTTDRHFDFDVIVFATGFDAIKGSWNRIDIRGRGGRRLRDMWDEEVKTYMGLQVAGYPNFFMLVGPQNGATFCNIPRCSALVIDWVSVLMAHVRRNGIEMVEPTEEAQDSWTSYCAHLLSKMLLGQTNSWFTGVNKNIEGRNKRETLLFVGGNPKFRQYCDSVEADNFRGFKFDGSTTRAKEPA